MNIMWTANMTSTIERNASQRRQRMTDPRTGWAKKAGPQTQDHNSVKS